MTSPAAPLDRRTPTVDSRAVRFSQGAVVALVALAAALRSWPLLALPAIHLALAGLIGPRANVFGRLFVRLVRPRLADDSPEDARPPRFASQVGATALAVSLAAHAAGLAALGWALAAIVAGLALLSAATGFCVGCRLYWIVALVRRGRPAPSRAP